MAKKKRNRKPGKRTFHLTWSDKGGGAWRLKEEGRYFVAIRECVKKDAIKAARQYVRPLAPSQFFTHNLDGKIGNGGNAEASYGCDSKRRKG